MVLDTRALILSGEPLVVAGDLVEKAQQCHVVITLSTYIAMKPSLPNIIKSTKTNKKKNSIINLFSEIIFNANLIDKTDSECKLHLKTINKKIKIQYF